MDVTAILESLITSFKNLEASKNIQSKINRIDSLIAYSTHRQDSEISILMDKLIIESTKYRDRTNESSNDFQDNYLSLAFEAAFFAYLKPQFNILEREKPLHPKGQKKSDQPDYKFKLNNVTHFIECKATSPSLFDKFLRLMSDFEQYYSVAKLLNNRIPPIIPPISN